MTGAARSYLFVPALRPDRVDKARRGAADEVIVDLEDAVAPADKGAAREALAALAPGRPVCVRINGRAAADHHADLAVVASMRNVAAVVVPKVESAADVQAVSAALSDRIPVVALVETARGITAADAIAEAGAVRIMFGSADYLADIGAAPGGEVLAYPRSRLVVASRAAGLPAPVDGPALAVGDEVSLLADARAARSLGMGAKLCIHPAQVPVVNAEFGASDDERRWARAVLAAADAHGTGVFVYEGAMVDTPVLARARRILAGP